MTSNNRGLHYALAASIALHALLLLSFPDLIESARRAASIPPQLIARLMEPAPPAPPASDPVVPIEKPAAKAEPSRKPPAEKPIPQVKAPMTRERIPEPAPEPAPRVEAPVAAAPAPSVASEPQAAAAPSLPAVSAAPESLSRDQYRLQLIDEARRHKRYPPLARENNWQGDVRVGVAVGANGRPVVTLKGSSGHEVLDRQALEMFSTAARTVPIPPPLRGKEFALEVRAVYGLED
jgi:protein TonB